MTGVYGRGTRRGVVAAAVVTALLAAGCSAGPSQRPPVAVVDDRLAPAPPGPATSAEPAPPPAAEVPATDLPWTDCTARTLTDAGLGAGPAGLVLECATLSVPLDPAVSGQLQLGLVRARTGTTPADAPPVVLTTGTDTPSGTVLARFAAGDGTAFVAARPVVALDRRGTGGSDPLDCLTDDQRTALLDVDPQRAGVDTASLLDAGREATQDCTDVLTPAELALSTDRAADDLEELRQRWGVGRLSLYGAGDGAAVALRYAGASPSRVARLVLDTPTDPGADTVTAAQSGAAGAEAALDAVAARCVALGCPLGVDPRAALTGLLERTRGDGGLRGAGDQVLTSGLLIAAVRAGLAAPYASGQSPLVPALAAGIAGDPGPLLALLDLPGVDGRFAARCSDAAVRPTPDQVTELVGRWSTTQPLFGAAAAARLAECLPWPTPPTASAPVGLEALPPVLVLDPASDPTTGRQDAARTRTVLEQAGATTAGLDWQGTGHPVLLGSGCVRDAVSTYLDSAALPARDTVCPP